MKSTTLIRIAGTAGVAFLTVCALRAQNDQRGRFPPYKVLDLGTLGGTWSSGFGINNGGEVAGAAATSTQAGGPSATAFLWRHGQMINLGTLGGANSGASGVNLRSEVALSADTATLDPNGEDFCYDGTFAQCLAAIWKNGKLTGLPTLRGYDQTGKPIGNSQAYDINDRGEVAGFSETDTFDLTCATTGKPYQRYRFEAVIWEPNGHARRLRPYGDDTVGFAWGINNNGEAVGASGLCSNTDTPPGYLAPTGVRSVLWLKDGTPIDLGNLGGPITLTGAINDRGDVAGGSMTADGSLHSYLWTKESAKMRDLGTLHPDDQLVVAPCCKTVNNHRQVAGFVVDAGGNQHAFIWQNGVMMDLNDLIPRDSGWNLQAAESINDAGEITGSGTINGETHAFLAVPCHDHDGRECTQDHDR
jgi:probable HAF family extracellular repeat protein